MVKIKLSDIEPLLLNPNLKESIHVKNIKEISQNFTQRREQIKKYVLDEDLTSSYTLFYLPTNAIKFHWLFDQIKDEAIKNKILNTHFVDVGCGPGTYSYSISQLNHQGEITCIDSSAIMLQQAEKILSLTFRDKKISYVKKIDQKIPNSTLFFGNSINEMGIQNALDIVNIVDPEVIIFIEPGTSELFIELKKMRKFLQQDYHVVYPCPSENECPSLWCHQVLRFGHENCVERLSQLVSLDRKIMPMCAHVYTKSKPNIDSTEVLLQRFINETKFSFLYEVCAFEDNHNQILKIEILKRNLTKEIEKKFKNACIGEKIKIEKIKLVNDVWRVNVNS